LSTCPTGSRISLIYWVAPLRKQLAAMELIASTMTWSMLRWQTRRALWRRAMRVARQSLEAGGEVQPRRRILELLAYDSNREWSSNDVILLYKQAHGDRDNWSFLRSALAALMSDERGRMLKRTGTPGKYMYKFADPHLRPYLRLAAFPRSERSSRRVTTGAPQPLPRPGG
jgi:hypothetical protein